MTRQISGLSPSCFRWLCLSALALAGCPPASEGPGEFFSRDRAYLLNFGSLSVAPDGGDLSRFTASPPTVFCARSTIETNTMLWTLSGGAIVPSRIQWNPVTSKWDLDPVRPLRLAEPGWALTFPGTLQFSGTQLDIVTRFAFTMPVDGPLTACGQVTLAEAEDRAGRYSGTAISTASWELGGNEPLGAVIRPSVPLQAGAVAWLELDGARIPLEATADPSGPVLSYAAPVLALGATYTVRTQDRGACGVAGPADATLTTLDAPGEFTSDGFESGSLSGTSADAAAGVQVVSGYAGVPPLSGQRSLLIPPATPVFFRLRRSGAQHQVALTYRQVNSGEARMGAASFSAGGVGALAPRTLQLPWGTVRGVAVADGGAGTFAADPQTLTLEVGTAADDVVLAVRTDSPVLPGALATTCGVMSEASVLLVDDVRME